MRAAVRAKGMDKRKRALDNIDVYALYDGAVYKCAKTLIESKSGMQASFNVPFAHHVQTVVYKCPHGDLRQWKLDEDKINEDGSVDVSPANLCSNGMEKRTCVICGEPTTQQCSRCRVLYFCSRECQQKDHRAESGHREVCKLFGDKERPTTLHELHKRILAAL